MNHISLHELMTTKVTCIAPQASLESAALLMQQNAHSCIVVLQDRTPIGILTERDMVKILADLLAQQLNRELLVSDLMSRSPICLSQNATLYEALVVTQTRNIRHIPLVDDQHELVGLITQTDIARAHFLAVEKHREAIEQQIRERTRDLVTANSELQALALQDGLLDIGNRRAMEVDIHFTHANALRYSHPYAVALLDVDHFKKYNDCYGHQAGDDVLIAVCECIKASLRASDRLYRYGGEEFLVLMPETNIVEAIEAIHRVLENIERRDIPHKKSEHRVLTLSAGVSEFSSITTPEWQQVVEGADQYLYQAKELGRNQVCWNVEYNQAIINAVPLAAR